jgi:hypothetical protein
MRFFLYIKLFLLASCSSNFELQEGDLLFQDLDSSPLCDAIELVTPGYKDANLSHIGFVIKEDKKLKVIEAIPPAVKKTSIKDFFGQSNKIIVGRLKPEYKSSLKYAIKFMKEKVDIEYDEYFILNNDRYYCSELIYEAFKKHQIFSLQPMTFMNPSTGEPLQIWKDYYDNIEIEIPEGKLGINPGIMSLSNKIEIVHIYEKPSRMKN